MAEYCLECWNKMHNTNYTEDDFEISECLYICECCERYTKVALRRKPDPPFWSAMFTWPFELVGAIVTAIGRGVRKLYDYYKERKNKRSP